MLVRTAAADRTRLRMRKLREWVMTGEWLLFLMDDGVCHTAINTQLTRPVLIV